MSAAPKKTRKRKPKNATWEYPVGSGIKIAEMPNKTGGRVFGVSYQVRIPAELVERTGTVEAHDLFAARLRFYEARQGVVSARFNRREVIKPTVRVPSEVQFVTSRKVACV